MIINHNLPALNTYNRLISNNAGMSKSLEKLSSGLRINRAADDAAGLAISEKMRAQVKGLDQAVRNSQDGISMIQTAEGALSETHSILQRMRELSVQAANDTYTSEDRVQIQKEVSQLTSEVDRIAGTTQFNGKSLLDGTSSALVSTDNVDTRVFMRDGLRVLDQYGQKAVGGGNYKIDIQATPGKTEIQKTDIMRVKHNIFEGGTDKTIMAGLGINATFGNLRANSAGQDMLVTGGVSFNFVVSTAATGFTVAASGTLATATTGSYVEISVTVTTGMTIDQVYANLEATFKTAKVSGAGGAGTQLASGNIAFGRTLSDIVFLERDIAVTGGTSITTDDGSGLAAAYASGSGSVDQGYGARDGQIAQEFTRLKDVAEFWDASGNFVLDTQKSIQIVQGDGKTGTMSLNQSDTIQDVEDKLNNLIYNTLGQKNIVDSSVKQNAFAKYVPLADPQTGAFTADTVKGTFLVQSAIAGKDGRLTFIGDDSILNALSLQTVQAAQDNQFTVNITDAHTNKVVAKDAKISGNNLVGVLQENVDVQFAANADVLVSGVAGEGFQQFNVTADAKDYSTYVHITDKTMVFQIGANQKQDIGAGIANMGSRALGINNVLVYSNSLANEAIGKIDSAINKVSSERSKLGAITNRLDHTISNLTTTSENLTAAESRIRDVDMAKEMMSFTKYQILSNAATSMLAQANQMPQSVLQLLR